MDDAEKFWVKLFGHEFVSCVRLLRSLGVLSGSPDSIAEQLFFYGDAGVLLHKFTASETAIINYVSKRPLKVELKPAGTLKIPTWQQAFAALAHAVEFASKPTLKAMRWNEIAETLDQRTKEAGVGLRIGATVATTFELLLPMKTASKAANHIADPVLVFNGNQRLKFNQTSDFEIQTISGRGSELECVFSHRFGDTHAIAKTGPIEIEIEFDQVQKEEIPYSKKPIDQWTATDLAHFIIDSFRERYKIAAPFDTRYLLNMSLINGGVHQLARMMNVQDKVITMLNYKSYIEWLFRNQKLDITSSLFFSAKLMEQFIVGGAKSMENLNAFNQK